MDEAIGQSSKVTMTGVYCVNPPSKKRALLLLLRRKAQRKVNCSLHLIALAITQCKGLNRLGSPDYSALVIFLFATDTNARVGCHKREQKCSGRDIENVYALSRRENEANPVLEHGAIAFIDWLRIIELIQGLNGIFLGTVFTLNDQDRAIAFSPKKGLDFIQVIFRNISHPIPGVQVCRYLYPSWTEYLAYLSKAGLDSRSSHIDSWFYTPQKQDLSTHRFW